MLKQINRKGNIGVLTTIGWGLVMFALIVGIGLVVLAKLGTQVATCATAFTYNETQSKCVNASGGGATDPTNTAWVTNNYVMTQLGSSGLAGWIPVIIVVLVAGLVLALFGNKKNY